MCVEHLCLGFRGFEGLGFGVWSFGLSLGFQVSGFRVWGLGLIWG